MTISRKGLVIAVLALVLLVGAALALPFVLESMDDGRVLVIQRPIGSNATPLILDEAAVRREAPTLADALDAAVRDGAAEIRDDGAIRRALDHLDAQARAAGARGFDSPPHNATLQWRGHVFIALLSVR